MARSITSIARELKKRSLFREVNARIRELNERLGSVLDYSLLCECGIDTCVARVEVPAEVFEEVRRDEQRFVVARGHERPEHDRVVAAAATYSIVA